MSTAEADYQKDVTRARRRDMLLRLVADSYKRMATNPDKNYRDEQKMKCDGWLNELTELWREDALLFMSEPLQ